MTESSFLSACGGLAAGLRRAARAVADAADARLRQSVRKRFDLDGLELYMAQADVRWHAMLDELGYPPLSEILVPGEQVELGGNRAA